MGTLLGMGLAGCDSESLVDSIAGDDSADQYSQSTLYLKDANGAGVAGISYSCFGGYAGDDDDNIENGNKLITSGNTPVNGDIPVSYWPGYDLQCTFTTVDAPTLYLYGPSGPINNAQVNCSSSVGFTGEDGYPGSINNAPSDTCYVTIVL